MIYVGIDPAFREGGFWICIIDMSDKTAQFQGFARFADFILWVMTPEAPDNAFWCIENSNMQNSSFDTTGGIKVAARKARNVGANQAVSQTTVDLLETIYGKKNVIPISPRSKGHKEESEANFLRIVNSDGIKLHGYVGPNRQDKRDAYKIAMIGKQQCRIHQQTAR